MTLSCGGNNSTTAQSVGRATAFSFLAAGAPRLKDGLLEEPEAKLAQKNRIKQTKLTDSSETPQVGEENGFP